MVSHTQFVSCFAGLRHGVSLAAVFVAALSVLTPAAHANTSVDFKPNLRISTEYDDNLYTENSRTRKTDSGFITRINPSFNLKKSQGRDFIRLNGNVDQFLYSNNSHNNHLNARAGLSARHSVSQNVRWDGVLDYIRTHSRRGDNEADPMAMAKKSLPLNRYQARTGLTYTQGAMTLAPRLGVLRHDYENVARLNGGLIRQDLRDRVEYTVGGRATYRVDRTTRTYIDGAFVPRKYDESSVERNSKGGKVVVGLRKNITDDVLVDVALGYMGRNYDNDAFKDINTLAADATLRWDIQDNTRLSFNLSRHIGETTAHDTGGILTTHARVNLQQTFTDELSGTLGVHYAYNDYVGGKGADNGSSDRLDKVLTIDVGARYLLTDALTLEANYKYVTRHSNRETAEYDKNIARIGLTYGF